MKYLNFFKLNHQKCCANNTPKIIRGRHKVVGPSLTAYARDNLGYVDAGTDDNTNTVLPSSHNTYCIPGPQSNKVRMPGTPSLLLAFVSCLGTASSRLMADLIQQEIRLIYRWLGKYIC